MNKLVVSDELAKLIHADCAGIRKSISGIKDNIEALHGHQISMMGHLVTARKLYKSDNVFNKWLDDNGLDETILNHHERAAAIVMGHFMEQARPLIESSERKTLRSIYEEEFKPMYPQLVYRRGKPKAAPSPKQPRPPKKPFVPDDSKAGRITGVDIKAKPAEWETFRTAAADEGKTPTEKIHEYISATAKGEAEPPATLSRTKQEEFERRLRNALKKQELEYDQKVLQEVNRRLNDMVLPSLNKRMDEYNRVVAARKGVMERAVYRKILSLLHPDRVQDEEQKKRYAEAFDLFKSYELVLVSEKELPTGIPPLPTTVAEMMARKAQVDAERKAKREAAKRT